MAFISIVSPCFNEAKNIEAIYSEVCKIFDELPEHDFEYIFIDNASSDGTDRILRELCERDKRVKAIFNSRNFGAIRSPYYALSKTSGDAVVMIVADFQEPPSLIPEFIRHWESGYKMVLGIKAQSSEMPFLYFMRQIYYWLVSKLSDIQLIRNFNGFGLYDRSIVDILNSIKTPYPYLRGIISEIGFEKKLIEFKQPQRKSGKSKMNFFILYDWAMLGFTSHTKLPLRLATMTGSILAVVSLFIGFVYFCLKLLLWNYFGIGIAPVVIGFFFFASVQLFFIGLLGEYILSIHTQVKNFPLVIERENINFDTIPKPLSVG